MDEFDFLLLSDFIGQNWERFKQFVEDEYDFDEEYCELIAQELDRQGGRS